MGDASRGHLKAGKGFRGGPEIPKVKLKKKEDGAMFQESQMEGINQAFQEVS